MNKQCFAKGTLIATLIDGNMKMVPVEELLKSLIWNLTMDSILSVRKISRYGWNTWTPTALPLFVRGNVLKHGVFQAMGKAII